MATQPRRKTRRGPAAVPVLNRDVIVTAALDLIDEGGLEAFSLRMLAQKLGVYPTAVYWYVPNRNELMAQVVAHILGSVPLKRRRRAWQQSIRDLFVAFRAAVAAHPNAAPLIGTAVVSNTSVNFDFVEHVLETLSRAGFSGNSLVAAYNAVVAGLVGFVAQEFASLPKEDPLVWQMQVQQRLLELDRDAYPVLAANLKQLSNQAFIVRWQSGTEAPLETSYASFIDVIVDGLESLAKSVAPGA